MTKANLPRVKPGTSKVSAADRRERFVEAYVANGGNVTQSAITAGFSEATAYQQGSRLLKDVRVASAIAARRSVLQDRLEITTDRVLRERARLAFFDVRKLFNDDGSPKPINELDDDTAAAIAGLEVAEIWEGSGDDRHFVGYLKKYKLTDKSASLTALEKHLGLYEADNKQKSALALFDGLPRDIIREIVERLQGGRVIDA